MNHPVFSKFEQFKVKQIDPDFRVNFLGVLVRKAFYSSDFAALIDTFACAAIGIPMTESLLLETQVPYPEIGEVYFEWIDLLEAVVAATDQFTVIELGAGYGRVLLNAAFAVKQYHGDIPLKLVGVEGEPTHFQWLQQHFRDNGINPEEHELIEAAVDAEDGEVLFAIGQPDSWYGQAIVDRDDAVTTQTVKAISLKKILSRLEVIDLMDVDVQGSELTVLSSAIDDLNQKVKKIHIGTHGLEIELGLRQLFRGHGWYKVNDFACGTNELTEWGTVQFSDGIQTWLNPRLQTIQPSSTELHRLQETMKVTESKLHYQLELNQLKPALEQAQTQLQQVQTQLQDSQTQLQQAQTQLQQTQATVEHLQATIAAMQTSKFWQLRTQWFELKQRIVNSLGRRNA